MEPKTSESAPAEAYGIVISRGSRVQAEPRFSQYIWSAVPEPTPDTSTKAA